MRRLFQFVIAVAGVGCAAADEVRPPSRIAAVEVQAAGAVVTRLLSVTAQPGGTTVILPDLPAETDRNSIRIRGEGDFGIGAVDTRVVQPDPRPANAPDIERQISALREQRAGLDAEAAAADSRRRLADVLLANPGVVGGAGDQRQPVSVERLAELAAFIETNHRAAVERRTEVDRRRRLIDAEIATLDRQLAADPARRRPSLEVRIAIAPAGQTAANGRLAVEYRVGSARWTSFYDARLATIGNRPRLELVRRAEIVQRSGENWEGVALTLSTARVTGRTAPPELPGIVMTFQAPAAPRPGASPVISSDRGELRSRAVQDSLLAGSRETAPNEDQGGRNDPPQPAAEVQSDVRVDGIEARFAVPGPVTVRGTGEASSVRLETLEAQPALTAVVVPMLDTTAYLQGRFRHESEAPLLPGRVALYRDGVFVGNGAIPFVAAGDDVVLGLGADPRIKVTRTPPTRDAAASGFLGNRWAETVEGRITVRNLGTAPLPVRVIDRVPVSETQDIAVEALSTATVPTERDLNGRRGVVAYVVQPAPGQDTIIRTGWRLVRPRDRAVYETEQPLP